MTRDFCNLGSIGRASGCLEPCRCAAKRFVEYFAMECNAQWVMTPPRAPSPRVVKNFGRRHALIQHRNKVMSGVGPQRTAEIAARVEAFVRSVAVPYEGDPRRDHHNAPEAELVAQLAASLLSREVAVPTQCQTAAAAVAAEPLRPIPHKIGLSAGYLDADSEPSEFRRPKGNAGREADLLDPRHVL